MGRKNNELQSAAPMSESVERTKKSKKKQLKNQPAEEEEKPVINDGANVATDTTEKKKKKRKDREAGLEEDKSNGEDPGNKKKDKKKKNGVVEEKLTKENESIEQKVDHEGIVVSGLNIKESKYAALKSFSEAGLPENVMKCCKDFSKPSPIQSHAWPFLLNGRDFIGIAATGSGKTLAFGIPAMMHCLEKRKGGKKIRKPHLPCPFSY